MSALLRWRRWKACLWSLSTRAACLISPGHRGAARRGGRGGVSRWCAWSGRRGRRSRRLLPIRSPYLGGREYTECEQWRSDVLDRLRAERPALVAVDMRRFYDERNYGLTAYSQPWLDSLTRTVTTLRAIGSAVLVLGPTPEPGRNEPAPAACGGPFSR